MFKKVYTRPNAQKSENTGIHVLYIGITIENSYFDINSLSLYVFYISCSPGVEIFDYSRWITLAHATHEIDGSSFDRLKVLRGHCSPIGMAIYR